MLLIDNINTLLKDDLKQTIDKNSKVSVAAACFSMYAYRELNHINLGASIGGLYRKDEYELPPDVIREMISNAVIHRSYLIEEKIQISIYEDRIEVVSPGTLYGGLDFKTIKIGRTKCRNQAIADIFQYMNIVEAWGMGMPRMIKTCKKYGLNEPVFEEFGDSFKVTVYRKQANKQINKQTSEQADKRINKRTSKHMKDILEYMLDVNEAMAKDIAKAIGLSDARIRVILAKNKSQFLKEQKQ